MTAPLTAPAPVDEAQDQQRIDWYRTRLDRDTLAALNQRSDLLGFLQTLGYLGLLTATGAAAWYASTHLPWPVLPAILFLHGMGYAFMINGFHELVHNSVFRTRWLNVFFLRILSFLGWYNHILFWASHAEHHKYTLHPPDDLEVVLPAKLTLSGFLKSGFVNPWGLVATIKTVIRRARGGLQGDWEKALFPPANPQLHRRMIRWERTLLVGHGLIVALSIGFELWLLPVLTTFAPFYGGWLFFLCNNAQHIGLQDKVPDFRLCCRTIILNPVVRFLYWHMNYHTEHHMYAAVPCYRLGRLHRLIRHDMPYCPVGLVDTWRRIIAILERQKVEPTYQFVPELPAPATS